MKEEKHEKEIKVKKKITKIIQSIIIIAIIN